jgi:hypothetical protein
VWLSLRKAEVTAGARCAISGATAGLPPAGLPVCHTCIPAAAALCRDVLWRRPGGLDGQALATA